MKSFILSWLLLVQMTQAQVGEHKQNDAPSKLRGLLAKKQAELYQKSFKQFLYMNNNSNGGKDYYEKLSLSYKSKEERSAYLEDAKSLGYPKPYQIYKKRNGKYQIEVDSKQKLNFTLPDLVSGKMWLNDKEIKLSENYLQSKKWLQPILQTHSSSIPILDFFIPTAEAELVTIGIVLLIAAAGTYAGFKYLKKGNETKEIKAILEEVKGKLKESADKCLAGNKVKWDDKSLIEDLSEKFSKLGSSGEEAQKLEALLYHEATESDDTALVTSCEDMVQSMIDTDFDSDIAASEFNWEVGGKYVDNQIAKNKIANLEAIGKGPVFLCDEYNKLNECIESKTTSTDHVDTLRNSVKEKALPSDIDDYKQRNISR